MNDPHDKRVGHRDGDDWTFPKEEDVPLNGPFRGVASALAIYVAVAAFAYFAYALCAGR